ncbi:unnamed protein product [Chrysoparadoxa australica]
MEIEESCVIEAGLTLMKSSKVVFAAIVRDRAAALHAARKRIDAIGKYFAAPPYVFVMENDSKAQETRQELVAWQKEAGPRVQFDAYDIQLPSSKTKETALSPERFNRLAALRNLMLIGALDWQFRDADFIIMIDIDDHIGRDWDPTSLAHSFGLLATETYKWDVVCANSVFKFPTTVPLFGRPESRQQKKDRSRVQAYYDSLAYRGQQFDAKTWSAHQQMAHHPLDKPLEVESCFGTLAIYRREALASCRYRPSSDCEHISLHQCIRAAGGRVWFNPRMVVLGVAQ